MITVEANQDEIRVRIPTRDMPAAAANLFVDWLRVEAAARRSQMTESAAKELAAEINAEWWARNRGRFTPSPSA